MEGGGELELAVTDLCITARLKGAKESRLINNLSFSVSCKSRLAVVGHSGCGKTMTALSILGLLPDNCHAKGSILWDGRQLLALTPLKHRALLGKELVLIPQSGSDFLNPSLTISHQMKEGLARIGIKRGERMAVMRDLLEKAGFQNPDEVLRSYPFQLSGGMAQRVVMAMASAGSPGLVIADEPTRGIDQNNRKQFMESLNTLFSQSAVILITHDISVAACCSDILVMKEGAVEEYGERRQVLAHPVKEYTKKLLRDLPRGLDLQKGEPGYAHR